MPNMRRSRPELSPPELASRRAALLALAATLFLSGCRKSHTGRSDWIIHSQIQFLSSDLAAPRPGASLSQFRLIFPYISGDLYGSPTTGDFVTPVMGADNRFDLDLNTEHAALLASLEPTDFSLP